MVKERWMKHFQGVEYLQDSSPASDLGSENTAQVHVLSTKTVIPKALSRSQKYRKMFDLGQKLAVVTSECGMPEFRQKYQCIENIISLWDTNTSFVIVPTDGQGPSTLEGREPNPSELDEHG